MSYALATLTALGGGLLAVIGLLYTGHRWADRYRRAPATMDDRRADNTPGEIPPLLDPQPADTDEWTTDLELWLRLHTALNTIEETLRDGLDDALHRFMTAVGADDSALVDRPGFIGIRELVGAA